MEHRPESKPMLEEDEYEHEFDQPSLRMTTKLDPARKRFEKFRLYAELSLLLLLVILSLLLLFPPSIARDLSIAPGPHGEIPLRSVVFMPDAKYVSDKTFASEEGLTTSLHNWLDLTTYGRGIIDVPDAGSYTNDPPMVSKHGTTDSAYMISVFHQLHCLSHLMQAYGELHLGLHGTKDAAFAEHAAHCFDYLRQSIMCNADLTLQGNSTQGFTWGTTHVCRDFAAIKQWGNDMASAVGNDSQHL